jgi:signal transduction histidine kinase
MLDMLKHVHMHIDAFSPILRELAAAREVDDVARVIRERVPSLIGADDVALVIGSEACEASDGDAVSSAVAIAPVHGSDPIAMIRACWSSSRGATPDEMPVLHAIADAAALAIRSVQLSHTVRSAYAAAEQSQRDCETLLATVGHELRQPLGAITNAVATLQRRVSAEVGDRARTIMSRQVEQLRRITDDLLDAVQMQRGTFTLNRVPLDLVALVSDCIDAMHARVVDRHQRLTFSSPVRPQYISADATRIRQIVSNLLDNAVKYTPTGGTIEVTVSSDGARVALHVRDSGRGIAPEHLPHIFKVFAQSRSGGGAGLGIGLSVVKRLTEAHGGTFDASSAGVGRGSTFTVRFPVYAAESGDASVAV